MTMLESPTHLTDKLGDLATDAISACLFLLALCLITLLLFCQFDAFILTDRPDHLHVTAIVHALLPAIFLYLVLVLFFGRATALALTVGTVALTVLIGNKKLALTGQPLSWGDVTNTHNLVIAMTFVPKWLTTTAMVLLLPAAIALAVIAWRHCRQLTRAGAGIRLLLILLTGILAFHPYLPSFGHAQERTTHFLARNGIQYYAWDWKDNVQHNGILMHLIQTSRRTIPRPPNAQQQAQLAALPATPTDKQPQHVFFILCEACWYNDSHFQEAVMPLEHEGMRPLRAVSPVYGGGTVNAAFEMLTSLPARGALQGVIYQEYAKHMRNESQTIPSGLSQQGYKAIALHNFVRTFWQRHIVMRKLGFDRFIGLEDMHYNGPIYYPRDTVLYTQALKQLREYRNQRVFFNLETVHTHAEYPYDNDWGEADYRERLATSMQDMAAFIRDVREISPDALFVIYGDHKPLMTKFFYENKIIPPDQFMTVGPENGDFTFAFHPDQDIIGDVPVWVGGGTDPGLLTQLQERAMHKPLYCLSAYVDDLFLGSQNPASRYTTQSVCHGYTPGHYDEQARKVPPWLYAASFFGRKAPPQQKQQLPQH